MFGVVLEGKNTHTHTHTHKHVLKPKEYDSLMHSFVKIMLPQMIPDWLVLSGMQLTEVRHRCYLSGTVGCVILWSNCLL